MPDAGAALGRRHHRAEGAQRARSGVNTILVLRAFERERAERLREAVRLRSMFLRVAA